MLKTRRTKQRTKKDLAGKAKRAKKLGNKDVNKTSEDAKEKAQP